MFRRLSISWGLVLGLAGCASNPFNSYKTTSDLTLAKIYNGQLAQAMPAESTSDPLFNLEYGSLMRLNQNYPRSNYYYSLAGQSIDAWANSWFSTRAGEISQNMTSLWLNDNVSEYQPKAYERSFLPTYHALNHLDLNDWPSARIEIKRMYQIEQATQNYNQALYAQATQEYAKVTQNKQQSYLASQILQKYDFSDVNSPAVLALKNSYQNAFSHYLAGFVFEALNEPSLARPGYIKAGQLNPTNSLIQRSIDNLDKNQRPPAGFTELLLVEELGHAPQIKSIEVHIPINWNLSGQQNSCLNMINVFYPQLVPDLNNQSFYPVQIDSTLISPLALVDVNLMAARALHDEIPHLIARNVAAAIRNIATSQAVCSGGGNLGSLLSIGTSLSGLFLDRADERIWSLLPGKIAINRLRLAYGRHTLRITLNGVSYQQSITLDQAYQVVSFRIMGKQLLFNSQS